MGMIKPVARKIEVVEYLRGMAALAVTWFHLTNSYSTDSWVRVSGSLGWLGVEVFFVISGFVIPLALARTYEHYSIRDFPNFLGRRIARIEPPYLVSVALTIALWHLSSATPGFAGQDPDWTAPQLLAHAFYLVPLTDRTWLQPVYWTLAWEFAFYLVMGVVFPLIGRSASLSAALLLTGLLLLAVTAALISPYALLFVAGFWVFRSIDEAASVSARTTGVACAALAMVVAGMESPALAVTGSLTALAMIALREWRAPRCLHGVLATLGTLSYSLYLTHVPVGGRVVNLGKRFVDAPAAEMVLSLVALGVSLAFAWLFHRWIEAPAVRASRRIFGKRS